MRTLGLSLALVIAANGCSLTTCSATTASSSSSSSSSSTNDNEPKRATATATNDSTTTNANDSKQLKAKAKVVSRGAASKLLIDTKNALRGADGTVVRDMNRGPPLKKLPEDTDDEWDGWDDDQWYEDDADIPYEEKALKEKEQGNNNNKASKLKKKEDTAGAAAQEVNKHTDEKGTEKKWWEHLKKDKEEEEEEDSEDDSEEEDSEDEDEEVTAASTTATKRKPKKFAPRTWESNANAVMKIIDADANPDIQVTWDGKILKQGETEDDEEEDSEDEDDEEEDDEDTNTYLPLPNMANLSPEEATNQLLSPDLGIPFKLKSRMVQMFETATSHECRTKIAEHMALFINGFAEETKFPFEDFHYPNTCKDMKRYPDWDNLPEGVNVHDIQYRTYQPKKEDVPEGTYIDTVEELQLLYVILTHDQPEATIRLMESVYVPKVTRFVIHVDGKEKADPTYERLLGYANEKNNMDDNDMEDGEYIRLVPREKCVRVNWGGYSMVEATLMALRTTFGLDYYDQHTDAEGGDVHHDNPHAFSFHKLVHIASTTYPLASNTEIRDTLASYPLDANFLHVILRPNNPTPSVWNYFVECDDALHRIYRLPALNYDRGNGVDIYTSSQWFIISREFAWYLASPPKASFVESYLEYIQHVVVADEAFFGSVIRNTHFCATLHNDNFLHLQFDRWENEATGARDQRKCVMKNPDHCGRSPTTMTVDYLPVLELSGDLFARKFDDIAEPKVKDYIDARRQKEEDRFKREAELIKESNGTDASLPLEEWEFQGEGVLLVAKETIHDKVPLCMGLAANGNAVMLQPCFKDDVPPTLSPEWEAGAVIIEEVEGLNRWDIGPCSSDGELKRNATGELEMIPGEYSDRGPSCVVKLGDGPRAGRCIDVESEITKPGGKVNVFPCYTKWHQLFSFGDGTIAPRGSIHASLPLHMARQMEKDDGEVHQHLCFGVNGRGDANETWIEWTEEEEDEMDPWEYDNVDMYSNGRKSLQLWNGQQLQTTPCSNVGGVVEFFYVPFIVEEYDDEEEESAEVADDEEL